MTQLFISDLHLEEKRTDITASFLGFLDQVVNPGDTLYILGDLFNVWLGDDHDTPFNQQILTALSDLPAELYFMHGNRDFLLGEAFCTRAGGQLLRDPTVITLPVESGEEKVLLMHGDSLCTEDQTYMATRKMLRSVEFQQDFLSRSLEERSTFADKARQESMAHTSDSSMDIMDVTASEVIQTMQSYGVRKLIHGHTHRPEVHTIPLEGSEGQRIVLGDWRPATWYCRASDSGLELLPWP